MTTSCAGTAALVALLASAALTGCAVHRSATPAPAAPTVSSLLTDAPGLQAAGRPLSKAAIVDVVRRGIAGATVHFTIEVVIHGSTVSQGSGVEDFSTDPLSAQADLVAAGTPVTMVIAGGHTYVKLGAQYYHPTGSFQGIDLDALRRPDDLLEEDFAAARDLGRLQVDGRRLHRYQVTVAGSGTASFTSDYVVDDAGLLAEVRTDLGDGSFQDTTYDGWGDPVSVTTPDPSEVVELPVPTS